MKLYNLNPNKMLLNPHKNHMQLRQKKTCLKKCDFVFLNIKNQKKNIEGKMFMLLNFDLL